MTAWPFPPSPLVFFGGKKSECAALIVQAAVEWATRHTATTGLTLIRFTNKDDESCEAFLKEFHWRFQTAYKPN